MFFINLGTYTKWMFILLSLAQRILLLIFQCHTVTHGTDLRRSPLECEPERARATRVPTPIAYPRGDLLRSVPCVTV